jgi:hypothetical protein
MADGDLSSMSDDDLKALHGSLVAAPDLSSMSDDQLKAAHAAASGSDGSSGGIPRLSRVIAVTQEGYPIFENPEHTARMMNSIADSYKEQGKGFLRGLRDQIDGGAQLLTRGLEAIAPAGSAFESFMKGERERVEGINKQGEDEYQKDRGNSQAPDIGRVAGNIIASAPVAAAVPGAAAEGLLARTGAGLVGGAATGALEPVKDTSKDDFWSQKGMQTAVGAGGGAVAPAVVGGASRVISPNASLPTSQARQLMDAGVTPTPGQILGGGANRIEEAAQSVPLVGDAIKNARGRSVQDFNRATIDQALAPIGEKLNPDTPLGREAIGEMHDKVGAAYDKLLPKLQVQADQPFIGNMRNLIQGAQTLTPDMAKKFDSTIQDVVLRKFSPNGGMTGQGFKDVESELGKLANNYSTSGTASERELGGALKQAQAEMRDLLMRSNPQHADELSRINQAFGNTLRVEGAAGRIGSDQGVFTPAQMLSSVRQLDPSMRKGSFARGEAPMQDLAEAGKAVLGNKVPDSGTPFRSLAMAAPALGGLYLANPAAAIGTGAAGAAAMGAYTKPGVSLLASLLASRPSGAADVADLLRKGTPIATTLPGLLAAQSGR